MIDRRYELSVKRQTSLVAVLDGHRRRALV
jgi:hypothetical protein